MYVKWHCTLILFYHIPSNKYEVEDVPEDDPYTLGLFKKGDESYNFHDLLMKKDHETRPIWVCRNKLIILETFSPLYHQAYDFLIAIAEPMSRCENL